MNKGTSHRKEKKYQKKNCWQSKPEKGNKVVSTGRLEAMQEGRSLVGLRQAIRGLQPGSVPRDPSLASLLVSLDCNLYIHTHSPTHMHTQRALSWMVPMLLKG